MKQTEFSYEDNVLIQALFYSAPREADSTIEWDIF